MNISCPCPFALALATERNMGTQHQTAENDQQGQADGGRDQGEQGRAEDRGVELARRGRAVPGHGGEEGDRDQDRGDGQVLGQQDGEGGASRRGGYPAALGHHRHDHGGRGQGQPHAQHRGRDQRLAHEHEDGGEADRAGRDLRQPEAEHQTSHGLEPPPRQLQPDHEQQEGDAQFGQGAICSASEIVSQASHGHGLGEAAQTMGTQQHAGGEEAQNGADLETVEQRHDDARRGQKDHQILVFAAAAVNRHSTLREGQPTG
jgi:hypothetical protein